MRQEIQVSQPPEQLLNEAASFFSKRRATISDRSASGFRFTVGGGDAADGGQVTADASAGGTKVTVQADGLGVMAIADGYVRELRKAAKDAGRQPRSAGGASVSGGFGDLRQRLGMPAPPPPRPRPTPPTATAEEPKMAEQVTSSEGEQSGNPPASADRGVRPDGPAPREAHAVHPETGPQGAPPAPPPATPPHPTLQGPEANTEPPAAASAPPAGETEPRSIEALAGEAPSAEQMGGVPPREAVKVDGETPSRVTAAGEGYAEVPPPTSAEKQ